MTAIDADIPSAVRGAFALTPPKRLGVAVSGGGDSVALLHALTRCFDPTDVQLHVATVDHGLRPEARAEAEWVADLCDGLGVTHSTLRWHGWDQTGNLQDQARRARYEMLADWARSYDISDIALGHTCDDQAETVLMRLARSSGVDGLAAMAERRTVHGITFVRPMLGLERAQLRSFLVEQGLTWIDDPSNEDPAFDRIKARQALASLAPLGLTAKALSDVAANMARARDALDWYSFLSARDIVVIDAGSVLIDHREFRILPREIARRLLVQSVRWVGGREYSPRRSSVAALMQAALDRRPGTLAGCRMVYQGPHVWICREYETVRDVCVTPPEIWDRRWRLTGPDVDLAGTFVRALGPSGLAKCEGWRQTGRPYVALLSSPSVWRGSEMIAAPLAGHPAAWKAELTDNAEEFYSGLLSH